MSTAAPLTAASEGAAVSAVYQDTLHVDATWHILNAKWWQSWCAYTGFDGDMGSVVSTPTGSRPGLIVNAPLLDPEYLDQAAILRKEIQEHTDYVMLEKRTANLLEGWYGVDHIIARKVVQIGPASRHLSSLNLHPHFFRLTPCDANGAPDRAHSTIESFYAKRLLSDVQEMLHNRAIAAEAAKAAQPPGAATADDNTASSANPTGVDVDMEEGSMTKTQVLPPVPVDDLEPRVRLWVKKPIEQPIAVATSSSSSSDCTALVPVSGVTDLTDSSSSLLPGGSEAVASPSSSSDTFERELKFNYTMMPPESLDDDEKLIPGAPGVRVTPLPKEPTLVDEWRLVTEDESAESIDSFDLPPLTEVLVETLQLQSRTDAEGVQHLEWVWPRARYTDAKAWNDCDVGDLIDVKDTEGSWLEAKVLGVKPGAIYVKYIGYKDGWNAWVPLTEARVAPHRKWTYERTSASIAAMSFGSASSYRSGGYAGYGGYSYYSSNEEGKPEVSGAVGLKNLGNTCFMNSTLQCLSHCVPLTNYFLSPASTFQRDLNRTNPLGWKGRVAEEYAKLLHDMWSDKYRTVAPRDFKAIISEFAPAFEGYQQHDSSELLAFLLDGLHEDCNRVLQKPATQTVESNGRPDDTVAAEAWETHLKRNQSVIIDLLHGQLKSTVVCPIESCGRVSVTFDPVQLLSVPLPVSNDTIVSVFLVYADPTRPITQVGACLSKQARLSQLKEAICAQVGDIANPRRLVFGDVFSGRVYKWFDEDGHVSDIKANDTVYAFECPEIDEYTAKDAPAGGFYPITIIYQKHERNQYYSRYNSYSPEYRWTNHGVPRVICLPKKTQATVRHILDTIHAKMAPYVRTTPPGAETSDAGSVPREEVDRVFEILLADERGENCGHHESATWSTEKCDGCRLREYSLIAHREAAAVAAAKAKTDATSARVAARLNSSLASSGNMWSTMISAPGEDGDADADEKDIADDDAKTADSTSSDDASSHSAVIVPTDDAKSPGLSEDEPMVVSPEPSETPAKVTDGFVQVESPVDATTPNLDVPFEVRLGPQYMYQAASPRCSFVVRLVDPPAPAAAAAAADDAVMVNETDATSEEGVPAAATVAPAVTAVPWFDQKAADAVVKHASMAAVPDGGDGSVNLLDCVKAFAKEETLSAEEMWYCRDCKEHRQASKKFDLWSLPEVLVIHLKRFSYSRYSREKITTLVNFPIVGLNLDAYCPNPAHRGDVYDLFAVSNHMGGLGGGHYNAYARNHTNGLWYMHDDSSVSRVRDLNDIRSSAAYVLFYQRRAPGATVPSEEEIQASLKVADAHERSVAGSTSTLASYERFATSSTAESELD